MIVGISLAVFAGIFLGLNALPGKWKVPSGKVETYLYMVNLFFFASTGLASAQVSSPQISSDFHQHRGGLQNCRLIFEKEKTGRVAFLGGSITFNPGWRDSVCNYLEERFPDTEFEFIAAGIPSMGTTPAAYRLERDVLSHGKVDLLFEEAAVNDATNGRTSTEQIRAMEGIIRRLRNSNPSMDLVILHFVDPLKMADYRAGEVPEVIRNHNRVAEYYQISTINLAWEVTERIDNGEFTWADDFVNLHPSPFGQGVYARSIIHFLQTDFDVVSPRGVHQLITYPMPEALDSFCYENGFLVDISEAETGEGWEIDPMWEPGNGTGVRHNYTKVPMLIGEEPGSLLKFDFKGKAVGIAVAAGPDAGMIEYRIDGGPWQDQNLFTKWSSQLHLPWYYTLSAELCGGEHLLELRVSGQKDERSEGRACRIRYFYVNGN